MPGCHYSQCKHCETEIETIQQCNARLSRLPKDEDLTPLSELLQLHIAKPLHPTTISIHYVALLSTKRQYTITMSTLIESALAVQNLFDTCVTLVPDYVSRIQPDESVHTEAGLRNSLEDAHSRCKIWNGNLGVFQQGHASLEWRLREASELRTKIINLLEHVKDDLEHCAYSCIRS